MTETSTVNFLVEHGNTNPIDNASRTTENATVEMFPDVRLEPLCVSCPPYLPLRFT